MGLPTQQIVDAVRGENGAPGIVARDYKLVSRILQPFKQSSENEQAAADYLESLLQGLSDAKVRIPFRFNSGSLNYRENHNLGCLVEYGLNAEIFHSCFWCRISTIGTMIACIQEEKILDTMARVCVASYLSSAAQFIHIFPRWNSRLLANIQTHSQKSQLRCKAWSAVSGIFDRYCTKFPISCPCCRLILSLRPLTAKSPVLSLIDDSLFHRLFRLHFFPLIKPRVHIKCESILPLNPLFNISLLCG